MQNNDYILPGVAAIALAILYPLYWIGELTGSALSISAAAWENMLMLTFSDVLFLAIGLLVIYVYLSVKTILNDQLNFKRIDLLLLIMVGVNAIFIGTLSLDLAAAILPDAIVMQNKDLLLAVGFSLTVGVILVCGLLDVVIGLVLLANASKLPTLVKIFAVMTLIQGVFEVTVVFSPASIVIFPVSLIVLAAFFLTKPESIEVV
ncbi:hypothetical protein [Arenicella xantha]|uniref:Uncharacterized protein n=1 Tax=Arenicella xantha TaxID=644221 RepID=A0A395JHP4_9GAMM|nr:hypothetical protein [Arenicella xantha]RBP49606.1 hypothetical protein DFR28_10331 [Arenicella xantha]